MQTFLPNPDFAASAAALDRGRLGKQRVETVQILRALVWPVYGWKNHPAVAMWRGFTPALTLYGLATCARWVELGHADTVAAQLLAFTGGEVPDPRVLAAEGQLPPWLGDPAVHGSHRAALLRKDPEHYGPLFDDVPEGAAYTWPLPAYPRWPVRRGHDRALTAAAAVDLLGVDVPLDPLVDVWEGGAVVLDGHPVQNRDTALAAALCTAGRTAWVTDDPLPALAPVRLAEVPRPHFGGSRQPDPAAVEAMTAEHAVRPDVLFLRDGDALPADVGLVVRDHAGVLRLEPARSPVR
ncbi:MSMEG_6728 family protein [Actinokineospora bangkokensis]|uniref:Cytoplasmic protein n=1 Tax=Actinokineospora bangkokensis TaxID=1193682 RepID=A0A1Q9LJX9_9PSEU|nr:hypothetical protein BJP25_19860 [Actinokineospora bangkokensis]